MSDCIFCRILNGDAPGSFVYRDELCSAFMDIQPVNPGHLLVVPNTHAPHLADLAVDTAAHVMRIAQRLAAALRSSDIPCDGINILLADGEVAGQEVFHVHLHVIPRIADDGFGFRFGPQYFRRPSRASLEDSAQSLRTAIESAA